jgi:hypothetical protein
MISFRHCRYGKRLTPCDITKIVNRDLASRRACELQVHRGLDTCHLNHDEGLYSYKESEKGKSGNEEQRSRWDLRLIIYRRPCRKFGTTKYEMLRVQEGDKP